MPFNPAGELTFAVSLFALAATMVVSAIHEDCQHRQFRRYLVSPPASRRSSPRRPLTSEKKASSTSTSPPETALSSAQPAEHHVNIQSHTESKGTLPTPALPQQSQTNGHMKEKDNDDKPNNSADDGKRKRSDHYEEACVQCAQHKAKVC